ncbi:GTP cyclohydrolase, FolE2/MptA family [Priestia megaterium]
MKKLNPLQKWYERFTKSKNKFLFDINQVGISNIKQPVNIHSSLSPNQQTTIATFTLTSSLPYDRKGTNMSRFVEQLEQYRRQGFILDLSTLHDFVKTLSERLEQKKLNFK